MKVKKLVKVISPNTDIVLWNNYGERGKIYSPINIPETYLERKVKEVWIDNNPFIILNITIEGTID